MHAFVIDASASVSSLLFEYRSSADRRELRFHSVGFVSVEIALNRSTFKSASDPLVEFVFARLESNVLCIEIR